MKKAILFVCVAGIAAVLSGCTPLGAAAGAGAAMGVAAAQEGGVRGAATDTAIRLQITDLWFNHDARMYANLSLTVKEGRVLIAGSVPKPQQRLDAVRLAWQAKGVKQIINEIRVDNSSKLASFVSDSWITGNIETRLLLDKNVQSINYSTETVNGTVYLMGVAQDRKELQRVLDYARNTRFVKNVVSYVRIRGETPSGVMAEPTGSNDGWLEGDRLSDQGTTTRGGDMAQSGDDMSAPYDGQEQAPIMPGRVDAEPLR